MKPHTHFHSSRAPRDGAVTAWADSSITLGLVVVDANRPASLAGGAAGLLTQHIAAATH